MDATKTKTHIAYIETTFADRYSELIGLIKDSGCIYEVKFAMNGRRGISRIPVRNTTKNWHTLGKESRHLGRSSVKRTVHPIVWPCAHNQVSSPGPTHKVSGENLKD
jgi:hypothetical protein